jgi:RimJ/RimL family protein N-acetyltransferase
MVTVRPAIVADVEAMLRLRADVAAEGQWIGAEAPLDLEYDRAWHTAAVEKGSMFVAVVDGEIVGVVGIDVPRYLVAELGMMVADGWRGQGVGSALLEAAIAYAREQGAHKLALQHWPHNEAAHALYVKYGFEQEGYLRCHYPRRNGELWDAVLMGLLLE